MKFGDCLNQRVNSIPFPCHSKTLFRCPALENENFIFNFFFLFCSKVDMDKVKLDVLRPWISKKITEYLHIEDDVVVEFVYNQLEDEKVLIFYYYFL